MAREQINARFTPDTADQIKDYADDHDITKSEAIRQLVTAGLDAEAGETVTEDDLNELRELVTDGGRTTTEATRDTALTLTKWSAWATAASGVTTIISDLAHHPTITGLLALLVVPTFALMAIFTLTLYVATNHYATTTTDTTTETTA